MFPNAIRCALVAGLSAGLLTAPAYAQTPTFQPGYVVPLGADTLRGQVRLLPERAQRECVFRSGPAAIATTYTPAQLRGYGLTGGTQFRRGRLSRGVADTTSVLRFEQVLVLGRATLLFAADESANPRFFLQMPGSATPTELRQLQRRVQEPNGRIFTQTINQYQQVLLTSLADCPALARDIPQLRFVESELTGLIQRYNVCTAPAGTVAALAPAVSARTFVALLVGGAFQQKMALSTSDGRAEYNRELTAPAVPVFGLQATLRNPRLSEHLGFSLGAFFQRRGYKATAPGTGIAINSFTEIDHVDIAYGADFLRIPLGISYEFGRSALRPFLEASYVAELRLNERDNRYTTYYKPHNNIPQSPDERMLFDGARGVISGLQVGAGLTLHRPAAHDIALRALYETTVGVSPIASVGSTSTMLTALLSYNLTKN